MTLSHCEVRKFSMTQHSHMLHENSFEINVPVIFISNNSLLENVPTSNQKLKSDGNIECSGDEC